MASSEESDGFCTKSKSRTAKKERRPSANLVIKEGFLYKKGGIIKSWSRRYFILNRQSLCYFRNETHDHLGEGLDPLGRIFLSDIVKIETEGVEKKKAFVFALHTKKRAVLLQASNNDDRDAWVDSIRHTMESDKEAERKDPFRRTLRRLAPGLKRVTLLKDPEKGIGCTIKNAAGHILVNRIVEDGPIAHTGVLRPGDEILDINGTTITGLQVSEVAEVIRSSPEEFLATVKPITAVRKGQKAETSKVTYSELLPQEPLQTNHDNVTANGSTTHGQLGPNHLHPSPAHSLDDLSSNGSLDDVGNYDDEDEGDIPPPLPPKTEDALILVDPPPVMSPPGRPPKPRGEEELHALHQKHKLSASYLHSQGGGRLRIQKSKSQGDNIDDDDNGMILPPAESSRHVQVRRPHQYEEVKPRILYADLDVDLGHKAKSRTIK